MLVAYQGKRRASPAFACSRTKQARCACPPTPCSGCATKESAKLVPWPLGEVMAGRLMSPTEWKQLKQSSELLVMAKGERLLYRGHCIRARPLAGGELSTSSVPATATRPHDGALFIARLTGL